MLLVIMAVLAAVVAALLCIRFPIWWFPAFFVGSFLILFAASLVFLLVICKLVDTDKPQEEDSKFFRAITRLYLQMLLPIAGVRIHAEGLEKLPKDGRFLMVCNHIHDLDAGILLRCFPDSDLKFIAKREIKDMFVVGPVLHKLGCQLINRENDKEALKTIIKCIQILKEDRGSVMVFPEGYVSIDGTTKHFRPGVFKIAQKANVPVVVCTLRGTKEVFPSLKKLKRSHVHMHLVDVIPAEQVKAVTTLELAEQVYEKMIADMGEAYRSEDKAMHPDLQREKLGIR